MLSPGNGYDLEHIHTLPLSNSAIPPAALPCIAVWGSFILQCSGMRSLKPLFVDL